MQEIYQGEDEEQKARQGFRPPTSAQYRLWNGPRRPDTLQQVIDIVVPRLRRDMDLKLDVKGLVSSELISKVEKSVPLRNQIIDPVSLGSRIDSRPRDKVGGDEFSRLSKLARWSLRKKDWLDKLLDLEMRTEEQKQWLNYTAVEEELTSNLFDEIWQEFLSQSIQSMLGLSV
ncbi:hypothetical protein Ciccas_000343 [Cichlidogyrus casuarinus]|uniref:DUF4378 domain-containing protein n=1 Tax=Cichlidogyrus casuarinus TaxID=1844966 RepID=A0ABD2QNH7_9PLAT